MRVGVQKNENSSVTGQQIRFVGNYYSWQPKTSNARRYSGWYSNLHLGCRNLTCRTSVTRCDEITSQICLHGTRELLNLQHVHFGILCRYPFRSTCSYGTVSTVPFKWTFHCSVPCTPCSISPSFWEQQTSFFEEAWLTFSTTRSPASRQLR